jgi:hypothetical protein
MQDFKGADFTVQFDGAYQKAIGGAGGAILVDKQGELVKGEAYFYGKRA